MKKTYIPACTLLALLASALSGCFFKSDTTGAADDIYLSFIYSGKQGTFLCCLESVFHATSKKSGGGATFISGHTTYRLSNYSLADGKLLNRAVLGDAVDERCLLLGVSPDCVWMYSLDQDLGLHARDPLTLQVKVSWPDILKKNPSLQGRLLRPKYYELQRYYGWDDSAQAVVVTDVNGQKLALDTTTFAATPFTGDVEQQIRQDNDNDAFADNAIMMVPSELVPSGKARHVNPDDLYDKSPLTMKGAMRRQPALNDTALQGDMDYLNGEIVTDPEAEARGLHNAVLNAGAPGSMLILHDQPQGQTRQKALSRITVQGKTFRQDWQQTLATGGNDRVESVIGYDSLLLLITQSYHETSSRTMGGKQSFIRFSNGYSVYGLKVVSAATGAVLGTDQVGDGKGMIEYVGHTPGALWFRSYDPALGLHARDPLTLKVKIPQSRVVAANPGLGSWAKDAPSYIPFRCAVQDGSVRMQSRDGYCYQMDPATLQITKAPAGDVHPGNYHSSQSQYAYLYTAKSGADVNTAELPLTMRGDIRKYIESGSGADKITSSDQFLNGKFLIATGNVYPLPAAGAAAATTGHSRHSDKPLLQSGLVFYTVCGATLEDTAHARLNAVRLQGTTFGVRWTADLGSIFFDPSKAVSKSGAEKVFSSGNPQYRYTWAGSAEGKLIVISMLHAECLEAATGKRLWAMEF